MADTIEIIQCRAEYSENILPRAATFNETQTVNSIGDGTVVYSDSFYFNRGQSIFCFSPIDIATAYTTTFNIGTALSTVARETGAHIFSFKIMQQTLYSADFDFDFNVKVWVNGINTETISKTITATSLNYYKWVTFGQTIDLGAGDEVDFTFEYVSPVLPNPNPNLEFYFDALKLEFDDRNLNIPSVYSEPIENMPDYGSVTNATTVVLSLSALNTAYPTATLGFRVYAPDIIAGAEIYHKTSAGWLITSATIAT